MRLIANALIVVGLLLLLPIVTIPWGLGFIAVGALLRIASARDRRQATTPLEPGAPAPEAKPESMTKQMAGGVAAYTVIMLVVLILVFGIFAISTSSNPSRADQALKVTAAPPVVQPAARVKR